MNREELDFIGSMNMCDEISNEAYKKIVCHCGEQEPCKDAISRQAVLDITWEEPSYTDPLNVLTEVRDKVKDLPSVNPQEPKTGHWIFDEILDKHYYCSECKSMGVDYWDFCPNCGAKMIEPQESEE